jgi:hypothetical protein
MAAFVFLNPILTNFFGANKNFVTIYPSKFIWKLLYENSVRNSKTKFKKEEVGIFDGLFRRSTLVPSLDLDLFFRPAY